MTTSVSAVISSDRFQRNSKLVVTDLGGIGFVVYVPPASSPLRFQVEAWLAIDALADMQLTELQLQQQLEVIPPGYETFDQYLQWLLSKRILLRIDNVADDSTVDSASLLDRKSKQQPESVGELGDVGETSSIYLFTLNPSWPAGVKAILLRILRIQIWMVAPMLLIVLAYLGFFLFAPAPSLLKLLGVGAEISTNVDILTRIVTGLLSVNILSTLLTWLAQSITGLGDGKIVLRFLFGFIPRFGVNPYKGSALQSSQWTQESVKALLCVAQPLLTRLGLASVLIVLLGSGRLHSGLAGGFLYAIANNILQISLFTGLFLALPFRISPGYRLMNLLTVLPPNTLGQSVRHFYGVVEALLFWLRRGDRSSLNALRVQMSTWRDVGLLAFAIVFFTLISAKFLLVLLVAIPSLSAGLPDVLGGASELVFILVLLISLVRFISLSVLPKLVKLRRHRIKAVPLQAENREVLPSLGVPTLPVSRLRSRQKLQLFVLVIGLILFIPINRTVTGSVMVSTERDLTVRAPADVRITKILQSGPSTQVLPEGTLLIELQSQQLDYNLFQITSGLGELSNELSTLKEQRESDLKVLAEVVASLQISREAAQVLEDQLQILQGLTREGASSEKMVQDVLLRSYEFQGDERLKLQQILKLQATLRTTELRIKATQQAMDQSLVWNDALLQEKQQLRVEMPFDGLITSTTSGLMWSFVSKGEPLLELKEGSLNVVNVLIPDHDRSLVKIDQNAEVRLYAEPNQPLSAVIQSIRPSGELIDEKVFFQVSLRLSKPLSPQLLQSSGAARINTGKTNLLKLVIDSLGRFILVDLWSWSP